MSTNNESATHLNLDEPDILDTKNEIWERFAEWLHCICIVTFDLELGQAMEVLIIT
jgi:hypothetical protein